MKNNKINVHCDGGDVASDNSTGPPSDQEMDSSVRSCDYQFEDTMDTTSTMTEYYPAWSAKRPKWQLVWCQERCHKSDSEALRNAISQTVQDLGGVLVCFKKAQTYEAWAQRSRRPPFVLLTDGREFKPCVQASSCTQPLLAVVLVDNQKFYSRVCGWIMRLESEGSRVPMRVIQDIAALREHLSLALGSMTGQPTQAVPAKFEQLPAYDVTQPPTPTQKKKAMVLTPVHRTASAEATETSCPTDITMLPPPRRTSCASVRALVPVLPSPVSLAPLQPPSLPPSPPSSQLRVPPCAPPCSSPCSPPSSPPKLLGCVLGEDTEPIVKNVFMAPCELAAKGLLEGPVERMLRGLCPSLNAFELQRLLMTTATALYED